MATELDVAADLEFSVDAPGREPVEGSLRGRDGHLELRVSDPAAFAGRGDSASVRGFAAALAARGLAVTVVSGGTVLLTLGATRTSWLQRRLTGSRHIRIGGARGAWAGARGRARSGDGALLPDQSLAPPATMLPLAPTFLRRLRGPVTTTHDPRGGGDPRLILAPRADPWPGDRQPVYPLRGEVTTIGSGDGLRHPAARTRAAARRGPARRRRRVRPGPPRPRRGQPSQRRAGAAADPEDRLAASSSAAGRCPTTARSTPTTAAPSEAGSAASSATSGRSRPGAACRTPRPCRRVRFMTSHGPVLVAGASGFVGRRLTQALEDAGHDVRAMTRKPLDYAGPGEPVHGDVHDEASLPEALEGCTAAYYLVHSLDSPDFERLDAEAARAFGKAAAGAGVEQIVYLGGLGSDSDDLSAHLRSRREVEGLLGEAGVPVTVLRAGIVVGHGGISWEITRQLVEHLPAMITPRWVQDPDAADRRRRRGPLPRRGARQRGGRRAGLRGRGTRGAGVRHHAQAGRRDREPVAADPAGAAADPEPVLALAVVRHRRRHPGGPGAGGLDGQRGRGPRRRDHARSCRSS